MAEPRGPDREGRRELRGRIVDAGQRAQADRDVDVRGREDARLVELAQEVRRRARAADVERVGDELGHAPASRTSLRSRTRSGEGRQAKTPEPGAAGPVIPRMKR